MWGVTQCRSRATTLLLKPLHKTYAHSTTTCTDGTPTLWFPSSFSSRGVSTSARKIMEHFDYFVMGGGSGGIASARRAASYGKKVGIADYKRLGGTCVNVGCVPKKIMWNVGSMQEILHEVKHFGFKIHGNVSFSWEHVKKKRDEYIVRLNKIYENNLKSSNVTYFPAYAKFIKASPLTIELTNEKLEKHYVTASHVLIATGGKPSVLNIPGEEYTINSDGFFELETLPKRVALIGAGYIAVELTGVFNCLGSDANLFVRGDMALRKFDTLVKTKLNDTMKAHGIKVFPGSYPEAITKDSSTGLLSLSLKNGTAHHGFDCILVATGRVAESHIGLDAVGVKVATDSDYVAVDAYQNTNINGIYALGDVCGVVELTPMAIAAGRRLADRLFGGMKDAKVSYENVPTVIFSHPPIATIGYTEAEAVEKFGADNLRIYHNSSVNLYYATYDLAPSEKPVTSMKLICMLPEEKVIGFHVIGMGADEMIQGFGVAIKMGATKADFDNCVAVHPTAAEEAVTMAPWGLAPQQGKL